MILNGRSVTGYWSQRGNFVVIAEDYVRYGLAVRHEMLHALLGAPGHPRSAFLGDCAAIVDCSGLCSEEAEPWSTPTQFIVMPPESLVVKAEPLLLPKEPDGERFLQLRVTVQNTSASAVLISVPNFPEAPPTFGYDLRGPAGGISSSVRAADTSLVFFATGETKEKLFEFLVDTILTQRSVPEGEYSIRGGYGSQWTSFRLVSVTP